MATISETEYQQRINQLERLNATLSAEIDLIRPLCDIAVDLHNYGYSDIRAMELARCSDNYTRSKEQRNGR